MKEPLKDTMNGKICLVTGATNGIGKSTALALAQTGATVVIVGRNPAKCAAVVSENKQISGNDAINFFMRFVGVTPAQGAQTAVYLATSPAVENVTGKYWEKSKAAPSGRATYDEVTWTRLWEVSDKLVAASAPADLHT